MIEEWRTIPSLPNYEASSLGRIRHGKYHRVRRCSVHKQGYRQVNIYTDKVHTYRVYLLVAETFHGPRPEGMLVRHLNGDNTDDRVENLRWGTPSENQQDSIQHGTNFNASKTHCKYDHPFTDENTYYTPAGARSCMTCRRHRDRLRRPCKR